VKCIPPVALPDPRYVPFRYWTRQQIRSYTPSDCKTYRVHHWRLMAEGYPANHDDVLVWAWRFVGHELRRAIRGDALTKRFWIDTIEEAVLDNFMRRFPRMAEKIDRDRPYPGLCKRIRLCIWDAQARWREKRGKYQHFVDAAYRLWTVPPRPEREIIFRDDWRALSSRIEAAFLSPRLPCDRRRVRDAFYGDGLSLPGYFVVGVRGLVARRAKEMIDDAPHWLYGEDNRVVVDAMRNYDGETYGLFTD
jgi:hypothetical protein